MGVQTPTVACQTRNMRANTRKTKGQTTLAFRYSKARRAMLEAIQVEKGHADLSITLREAADQYIERYLRREQQAGEAA